jgi:AraC family transcriptional regulator, regulatory protein of adaptative response / methylated-DNA-[protein]-cysteine methyltransferase
VTKRTVEIPYADAMEGAHTVQTWARQAGISRPHLSEIVKSATGHSAGYLLRLAYVLRALDLMRNGLSMTDAAYAAGYSDPFTFSRACKRFMGQRPSRLAA